MSLSHQDQILWPIYITRDNLDAKMGLSQNRLSILLLGFILIVYKQLENSNNKDRDLKTKIYHLALKTMLERK